MNLSWLEDYLALASTGNFSRAAQARHMTQPAFGRRIRALEEWLGTELFDRSAQPIRLTDTGLWFHSVAQDLLTQLTRLPDQAQAIATANSATLRFTATHALSFTFMPGWLRNLESHTDVGPVQLVSDMLLRCEALLRQGKVQFVISHAHPHVAGQLDNAGYPSLQIGADMLIPVCAVDDAGHPLHPLSKAGHGNTQLLDYSTESGIGRILRAVLGAQIDNTMARPLFTAHLASVLRTMTLDGRGVAWLPRSLVAEDLKAGRLVHAATQAWHIPLQIRLYRDRNNLGRTAEAFWQAVSDST